MSEVPLGTGILDLKKMIDICKKNNPNVNFNLEMITAIRWKLPVYTEDYWATFMDTGYRFKQYHDIGQKTIKTITQISSLSDRDKLKS